MALFEATDEEPVDPLGREPGRALCPARVRKSELINLRKEQGESWFQAMYQGHPSLEEGNIIKRPFNYYTLTDETYCLEDKAGAKVYTSEKDCYRFGTLDMAGTDAHYSDWTVLMVFDVTKEAPNRRLVLRGIERVRITTENHEQYVKDWYQKWNLNSLHIEKKTFGLNLINRLIGTPGMIVSSLDADQSKVVRALPVQYEIINEMVWFPKEAEWKTIFEREVTKFPNATHDDMVDCLGYGVQVYKTLPAWTARERDPETNDEKVWAHMRELSRKNRKGRRSLIPGIGRW